MNIIHLYLVINKKQPLILIVSIEFYDLEVSKRREHLANDVV